MWQALAEDRSVPVARVGRVASSFWAAEQGELTAPYAEKYLGLLHTLDRGGMIPAMVYTRRLFPLFGIETGYLARAEQAATTAAPVVRKSLVERADEVRRMLAARSAGAGAGHR